MANPTGNPPPGTTGGTVTYTGVIPNIPDGLKLIFGVLVIGLALEVIGKWNMDAAYLFAVLILVGYAAMGSRLENAASFLRALGVSK